MSDNNLLLHCGSHQVTRDDVYNTATPAQTDTYYPLAHSHFIERVEANLAFHNYKVVGESHGLSHDGDRYFGTMQVSAGGDYGLILGLRNSHDKRFPAGLVAGSRVFVCDNLAFSGEVSLARRHTKNIIRDLPGRITDVMGQLKQFYLHQEEQIAAYKQCEIGNDRACAIMIEAAKSRIIGYTKVPHVLEQWEGSEHEEFAPRTAWSLFNAFTEVGKGWNLTDNMKRTQRLHSLFDQEVQMTLAS
jgi:hypothetical protein